MRRPVLVFAERLAGLLLALIAMTLLYACSGSSSNPAAPTPTYPSLMGGWSGTQTINATVLGTSSSQSCSQSWTVAAQSGGAFSGTWQSSSPCNQSGALTGSVTTTGGLTVSFGVSVNDPLSNICTLVSSTGFSGAVTGSISVQSTEQLRCASGSSLVSASRSIVVALNRR